MRRLIVFGTVGSLLLWGLLLFSWVGRSRINYYVIDEIKTYFAVDAKCVYINTSPYEISNKKMLKGWSSYVKKNKKGSTILILPRGTGNIVAVHTESSAGSASRNPWLLWLPYDIDRDRFPSVVVEGHSVKSNYYNIRPLTHKELKESSKTRNHSLGIEAAEEVQWFLKEINVPTSIVQLDINKICKNHLTVSFSNGDYIDYNDPPAGDGFARFPVLYRCESFPSTIVLNGCPHGSFYCKEVLVLEFGGEEYPGYKEYPPTNAFFLNSQNERIVLREYNRE